MIPYDTKTRFREAYHAASLSVNPTTQVGAVLQTLSGEVLTAANQPVLGQSVHADDFEERRYIAVEHAERAVIYQAAAKGISTTGAVLYAPWSACVNCARAIVSSGIVEVHRHLESFVRSNPDWMNDVQDGERIMLDAGVRVRDHSGPVGAVPIMFNREVWMP